jgi:hypothetical protein
MFLEQQSTFCLEEENIVENMGWILPIHNQSPILTQTYRPSGRDPLIGSFFISLEPNWLFRFPTGITNYRSTGPFW